MAEIFNRKPSQIRQKAHYEGFKKGEMAKFSIIKAGREIARGTASECAEHLLVTPGYIRWLATPTAHKIAKGRKRPERATIAIRVGD